MEDGTIIFAIIGVIISAIGITGGFVYNAKTTQQNTRMQYYQVLKDVEKEFHEIERFQSEDIRHHAMRTNNFAVFLIKLINRKMVPKEYIYPQYDTVFQETLWIQKKMMKRNDTLGSTKEIEAVEGFCKENNIQEKNPKFEEKIAQILKEKKSQ